jgi:hypothetical protein
VTGARLAGGTDPSGRVLRRVDWRFLLAPVSPVRPVTAADRELQAAAASAFGTVTPLGDRVGGHDVAVLSDPSPAAVRRAYAALDGGGVCYLEWNRPSALGWRRGATVRAAGFTEVDTYWAWPPPRRGSPRFWVPIDAPNATAHFLAHRPAQQSRLRRAAVGPLRIAWKAGRSTGLLAPMCVVARKPPSPADGSLTRALQDGWASWGLGPTPARLDVVLLTGGESRLNKVVALVFADGAADPALAVKFARVDEADAGLEREASALTILNRDLGATPGVPRIVFAKRLGRSLAVGETPVIGEPVIGRLTTRTQGPIALQVADVLARFAHRGGERQGDVPARVVEPVVAEFEHQFAGAVDGELVDTVRDRLSRLPPLPATAEHRDCSPWNVLVMPDGGLGFLDWESAEPAGLPALDLVYFLANTGFVVDGTLRSGREVVTYAAMLDAAERGEGLFAAPVTRYCDAVGIDPSTVPVLRAVAWMVHARSEYAATNSPEASVFAALLREEVRRWHR